MSSSRQELADLPPEKTALDFRELFRKYLFFAEMYLEKREAFAKENIKFSDDEVREINQTVLDIREWDNEQRKGAPWRLFR